MSNICNVFCFSEVVPLSTVNCLSRKVLIWLSITLLGYMLFCSKILIFKSSVYKTFYKAIFITHWCKTMKLCKQPDWCFLSINWCWKTVSFIFDKNIKKWQKFIAFFFNSKFYIFMVTVKEFKKNFCILFISKYTKNIINITFIHEKL